MNALMVLRIALKALRVNKLRSSLTMLGMIIGVAAVIAMLAIGGNEVFARRLEDAGFDEDCFADYTRKELAAQQMYTELVTRPDLELFLPPIGGATIYFFGDMLKIGKPETKIA